MKKKKIDKTHSEALEIINRLFETKKLKNENKQFEEDLDAANAGTIDKYETVMTKIKRQQMTIDLLNLKLENLKQQNKIYEKELNLSGILIE